MSNALYQKGKHAMGNKEIELDADTLTAHLVLNSYNFNQSHISVATSINPHIATAGGVANSASVNLSGVSWAATATLDALAPGLIPVTALGTEIDEADGVEDAEYFAVYPEGGVK